MQIRTIAAACGISWTASAGTFAAVWTTHVGTGLALVTAAGSLIATCYAIALARAKMKLAKTEQAEHAAALCVKCRGMEWIKVECPFSPEIRPADCPWRDRAKNEADVT